MMKIGSEEKVEIDAEVEVDAEVKRDAATDKKTKADEEDATMKSNDANVDANENEGGQEQGCKRMQRWMQMKTEVVKTKDANEKQITEMKQTENRLLNDVAEPRSTLEAERTSDAAQVAAA